MKTIIYIADPEILAIPIVECHEPLIDLKDQYIIQYGPPPESSLTKSCYTKLRQSVYGKLCAAQNDLPTGLFFKLYEGFRSKEVQKLLFYAVYANLSEQYPKDAHEEKFRKATRVISPVVNLDGTINVAPHNTGAAIDIEIVDETGKTIDCGMELQDWHRVDPDWCLTDYSGFGAKIMQNRRLLLDVMNKHDFVNYPNEWWHFSYGDRYWAYHKKHSHAIYGPAE